MNTLAWLNRAWWPHLQPLGQAPLPGLAHGRLPTLLILVGLAAACLSYSVQLC